MEQDICRVCQYPWKMPQKWFALSSESEAGCSQVRDVLLESLSAELD